MKTKRLLAIIFICVLVLSVSTATFAASVVEKNEVTLNDKATRDEDEPENEWDEATNEPEESDDESSEVTITGFSVVSLPSKTFTEPLVSEKMIEARKVSRSLQDNDKTLMDYLSKASIAYNMDGAVINIAFSDGSTYRMSFTDDVDYGYYVDADYDYPVGHVMGMAYSSIFGFSIEDIGNYQARIFAYGFSGNPTAETVFTAKSTAGGGSVTPSNNQSGESNTEQNISDATCDQESTEAPAPATTDQSSINNGKVTANNQVMQTGASATVAYVASAAAMLAGAIAIILKKKIFS